MGYLVFNFQYGKKNYTRNFERENKFTSIETWKKYYEFVLNTPLICQYFQIGDYTPKWRKGKSPEEIWSKIYTNFFLTGELFYGLAKDFAENLNKQSDFEVLIEPQSILYVSDLSMRKGI